MSSADKLRSKVFGTVDGMASSSSSSSPRMGPTTKSQTPTPPRSDSPSDPPLSINIPKPPPLNLTPMPSTKSPHTGGSRASAKEKGKEKIQVEVPHTNGNGNGGHPLHSPRFLNGKREGDSAGEEKEYTSTRDRYRLKMGIEYKSVEHARLQEDEAHEFYWKRWGPYLSERQWATVREDYSADGNAWAAFPHAHARSRAYRWGEDGLAGLSDNHLRLCFSLALWNGVDPILKERLFGVTGHQGNHGEDVKEMYWYLDSTPTHSYMKFLYKYPQKPFPYEELVSENQKRSRDEPEYEIMHTGIWNEDRYWDVFVEYAKDDDEPNATSIRITAYNRGPDPATLHIIPQLFFPNSWSWSNPPVTGPAKPMMHASKTQPYTITANHPTMGTTRLFCTPSPPPVAPTEAGGVVEVDGESVLPELLFTENDTNFERLWNGKNASPYVKDAFHDHIIPSHRPKKDRQTKKEKELFEEPDQDTHKKTTGPEAPPRTEPKHYVNPAQKGTKSAAHYVFRDVPPRGGCAVVRLKLTSRNPDEDQAIWDEEIFDDIVEERREEADEFYNQLAGSVSDDFKNVMRQALAGMLWSKQFYQFIQDQWIKGDPGQPPPPPERKWIRNQHWKHLYIADILSMPDKWEYPFFAAWDSAFHCIPLAMVDPAFAKKQLDLLVREWYMKPDGQIPAYEWNFSDVNPPVHAWATFRVFKIERKMKGGHGDLKFLERVFQKLLINFTWWVNRKDQDGQNVFEGGFLGLDNIGAFNRSEPLPTGGDLRQADGTAWMAFYSLVMLSIALELAKHNDTYEDIASKFFEHFIFIADAMTYRGDENDELSLWNEQDGMYYDAIQWGVGSTQQLPIRSLVGLIPLFATLTLEPSTIDRFKGFKKRMEWFIDNRPEMSQRNMANMRARGRGERRLLALASEDRLVRILEKMLDEKEFFSEFGIRSLSLHHKEHPWGMHVNGEYFGVEYWPGDSKSGMFGGNSNWRGPIWLATNFLLIESLQRFHQYYGDALQVECPTGSGDYMNLARVAEEVQHRIIHIFARDPEGSRATNGGVAKLDKDPHFRDYVWFHEFFHADDGRGLGASHQTGWTGLVAYHIVQSGLTCRLPKTPRTPRSIARHYFDEHIEPHSEVGTPGYSITSAFTSADYMSLADTEPEPDDL